jgi:hypothetical protein
MKEVTVFKESLISVGAGASSISLLKKTTLLEQYLPVWLVFRTGYYFFFFTCSLYKSWVCISAFYNCSPTTDV